MKPESFDRYNGYEGGRPWARIWRDFDGQTTQHVTMKLKTTKVEPAERYSQQLPAAHFEGTAMPVRPTSNGNPRFDIEGGFSGIPLAGLRLTLGIRNVPHDVG